MSSANYSLETKQSKLFIVVEAVEKPKEEDRFFFKKWGLDRGIQGSWPAEIGPIPSGRACELIREASLLKKLKSRGQKVLFEPFTQLDFRIEVRSIGEDRFYAEGFFRNQEKNDPLSKALAIFPSTPPCIQRGPLVQKLSKDISFRWLERLYPEGKEIDRRTLELWLEELKEEGDDAPLISIPYLQSQGVECWPVLKLQDRFGAFADLWLDYGSRGERAFHDETACFWRQCSQERLWEKDLLETAFCAKKVDASHYYCPTDQISSSLSFLLDIGWKIVDCHGKRVVRQSQADLCMEDSCKDLLIKGRVIFGEHAVDVGTVVGTFNRRERFIELSPGVVGLIDSSQLKIPLDVLVLENSELKIPKIKMGLLQGYLEQSELGRIWSLSHDDTLKGNIEPSADFVGSLHSYQKQGLEWLSLLQGQGLAGLLADDMGLGKTIQTLALLSQLRSEKPILIVAPTSLLFNWLREWEKFLPQRKIYVHHGKKREEELQGLNSKEVILTSYALIRQDKGLFSSVSYAAIIIDEAQAIKNPESQIAEAMFGLQADFRLAITGTPVENRADDLWSIFHFLLPGLLGSLSDYRSKILAAEADRRYADQCKKCIRPFILRRKKEIVAQQLPAKLEQIIWVEMEPKQRQIYENMLAQSRKMLNVEGPIKRVEVLEKILRLRQICCHPVLVDASQLYDIKESGKLQRVLEDVEEIVQQGEKVLIYSQFTSLLQLLRKEIEQRNWQAVYLDGATKSREEVVRKFQEDPGTHIFLISLKAGGVGLNLTKANYVLLIDPWWNDAVERQAIDRAHRLGRTSPVIARRYVTALSIEEKMMRLKEHKIRLEKDFLEEMQEAEGFTLQELMNMFDGEPGYIES